jgi:hypothetical protein
VTPVPRPFSPLLISCPFCPYLLPYFKYIPKSIRHISPQRIVPQSSSLSTFQTLSHPPIHPHPPNPRPSTRLPHPHAGKVSVRKMLITQIVVDALQMSASLPRYFLEGECFRMRWWKVVVGLIVIDWVEVSMVTRWRR